MGAVLAGAALMLATANAPASHAQHAPQITWEQCPPSVQDASAQCGRVNVPMQYDNPQAGEISVGFAKVPAQDPSNRRGTIFGNPGGPGIDTYSYFTSTSGLPLWPEQLRNEWDLITVQPRGLAHSTQLNCSLPDTSMSSAAATFEIEAIINRGGVSREMCERARPGYTKTITTEANARDWDVVRQALGEDTISIIGASYGSYLGSAYATLFPERTDKLVLDSAMDPNLQYTQLWGEQIEGYERALHDYFEWVAANNESFQMGDTPLKAYQYWSAAVVRESGTNPTIVPPPARIGDLPPGLEFTGQTGADALTATGKLRVEGEGIVSRMLNPGSKQHNSVLLLTTQQFLSAPAMWGRIASLTNGTASTTSATEMSPGQQEELARQNVALVELQSVQICNENVAPADPYLIPAALWAEETGDIFAQEQLNTLSGLKCHGAEPVTGKIDLDGSKLKTRPLQINSTGDPQTLYSGRFGIAEPMGSHLVTVHGPGHGHFGTGNGAVDRQVIKYLRTGELGPVDQPGFFDPLDSEES